MKTLTAAIASAVFVTSAASAAGLGKLTVLSALGQPLRAEIELTTSAGEDPASMAVKLATPEAFRSANIDFNPALLSLRFAVEQRGGRQIIRVNSSQPLNEPFVDMLLELTWNNGRLVREYTFLLDPAELRTTQPAQVASTPAPRTTSQPAVAASAAAAAAAPAADAAERARIAAAREGAQRQAAQRDAAAAESTYRVRRGDTLSGIATRVKPAEISLDMMLVALYRANPEAFIGNNMNRLKSGQILSVPDSDALRGGASQSEARGVVVAHAADFDAYRNKLAGQVAASTPASAPQGGQSATGRVTARVEEQPTAANEAQDKLRLSKATAGAAGTPQTGTASVEDTLAKQRELEQAEARVKELEKNVGELENLMTVPSRAGAEAEQAAAAAPVVATPAKPVTHPRLKKPVPAPEPEKGLVDTLLDNMLYIAAALLVLLLILFGIAQRRKRNAPPVKPVPTEPSVLGAPGASAQSLFAESGGQSVDTNNSVFNSSFAPSASQLDTNEVDPVAEADVYIAYGRDAQAEEILKEALRTHPDRHPVRLKLLEIYATRKDARAFEVQARELHALTNGQGDDWAHAAALGLGIDPQNPLYANAAPAPAHTPSAQERSQQAILSQQYQDALRADEPAAGTDSNVGTIAGAAAAGAIAGASALSLSKDDADRTAAPQAEPVAAPRLDDNTLDFDLGGLTFEPVTDAERTEPTPAPAPASRPDPDATAVPDLDFDMLPPAAAGKPESTLSTDVNDLEFDMDFDAPPAGQPVQSTAATPADARDDFSLDLTPQPQVQATPVDMAGLAKDFDGLPSLPASPAQSADATAAPSDPLFDLDSMDFGAPVTPATPAPVNDPLPAVRASSNASASEDPLFDLDAMDFGVPNEPRASGGAEPKDFAARQDDPFDMFDLPDTPAPVPAPEELSAPPVNDAPTLQRNSLDALDFDLDLPASATADAPTPAAFDADPVDDMAAAPAPLSPEHMEMETKLDLAVAYQEIGDKEGARELLDEVIKGGSTEQVGRASAMRELLA
ncbi:pilus assembly protein FimV [Massilia aurea]|uniref:Pilus assembly protein FimV n=1 Tax=Massilia aurea TaxID=373040 RepID=A0A7X0CFD9_9BURK|nr:FimV/HubP family polar landmark protein [Massilia aurea]MBB6134864.1 pilus assembly protein FimV [Massilia aurea]